MATKPIERLLFAQGGHCFFCKDELSASEASIEHLVAKTNGGKNDDSNTVACCKSLNALLGQKSLKEKLEVVLNQKGPFRCPDRSRSSRARSTTASDKYERVVTDLRKRDKARPATVTTLKSTINNLFQKSLPASEQTALVEMLKARGVIVLDGTKVSYNLR